MGERRDRGRKKEGVREREQEEREEGARPAWGGTAGHRWPVGTRSPVARPGRQPELSGALVERGEEGGVDDDGDEDEDEDIVWWWN